MAERPLRTTIRLADPAPRLVTPFELRPDAPALAALAEALGITAIRKLSFTGKLTPTGRRDWLLEGALGATVVQPCVLTLAPVTTRIDESVTRRYLTDLPDPGPGETEFTDDESEALPPVLDLSEVMAEALALALPPWPRAEGAELGEAGDGSEEAERPFAGLAALRDQLGKSEE